MTKKKYVQWRIYDKHIPHDANLFASSQDRLEEINVNVDTWATCETQLLGKETR